MKSKILVMGLLVGSVALTCKTTQPNSTVKASGEAAGFDVNDVSILFNRTGNGAFYPNIDATTVWPQTAFQDLVGFAKNHQLDGVQFGQFLVPSQYVSWINKFTKNPTLLPSDSNLVQEAAKDIADGITKGEINCTAQSDGSMKCIDVAAQVTFTNHRDAIENINNWRIVGMRMDLCAGAHKADISSQCEVEFRLIAQPYGDFAPVPPVNGVTPPLTTKPNNQKPQGPFMFDVSAHLLYKMGTLDLNSGNIVDDRGNLVTTVNEIMGDLQKVKNASSAQTNGQPLGVHPGLINDPSGSMGKALTAMIAKYTGNGNKLTNVTSMHLAGPVVFDSSIWVFFQGVIQNARGALHWSPTPITGSTTIWSIRTKSTKGTGGKMIPPPQLQNDRLTINSIFEFGPGAVPPQDTVTTLPQDIADLPHFFDNPGRYGDPKLSVNGSTAASVKNTDCISCHMTATRSFEWSVRSLDPATKKHQPSLYVPPVGVTAYLNPNVIPRIDYNLRNFGYFLPPPIANPNAPSLGIFNFAGTRQESPAVMPRVVYESAELVHMLNSRFLKVPNPGLVCKGEDPKAALAQIQSGDAFSNDARKVVRRRSAKHAQINDCLLFDSFKPGKSYASCMSICSGDSSGASDDDDSSATQATGNVSQLESGTFVANTVAVPGAAPIYEIDHVRLFTSGAPGVSTWRMEDLNNQSNEGLSSHHVHFQCSDATGSTCKISSDASFDKSTNPDKIQIIDSSTIRVFFSGKSADYKRKSSSSQTGNSGSSRTPREVTGFNNGNG